jgi:hypothetical protein
VSGECQGRARGHNHVDGERDQFRREPRTLYRLIHSFAILDNNIPTVYVTEFAQSRRKLSVFVELPATIRVVR